MRQTLWPFLLVALAPATAFAQPPLDIAWSELTPPYTRARDSYFGRDTAFDGERIAVTGPGRVDVYTWDGAAATYEGTAQARAGEDDSRFADGVGMEGDRMIVGGPDEDSGQGVLYFFTRQSDGSWLETRRDDDPGPCCDRQIGSVGTITMSGTRAAVGSPYQGLGNVMLLRADASGDFAFTPGRFTRWMATEGNLAGFDTAIDDDYLVIGNIGLGPGSPGGVTMVHDTGTDTTNETTILDPTGEAGAQFGIQVDLDDTFIYVGARYDGTTGFDTGALYVFRRDDSSLVQTLYGSDARGRFAAWMDVDGDWMVVGAPAFERPGLTESPMLSSVYFFRRDASGTWQPRGRVSMFGGELGANFGQALHLHGNVAVVSAPTAMGDGALHGGRVFVAVLTEPDGGACSADAECTHGNCVSGVCCDTACGACSSCGTGTCTVIPGCDAGVGEDAGVDAGERDAGSLLDASIDTPDASHRDAGSANDASLDGGDNGVPPLPLSCTCRAAGASASSGPAPLSLLIAALWAARRRRALRRR